MFYVYFILLLIKIFIMARLPQGILGGVLGKVGNVVGSSWKGIPILKSRPLSVANPRTTKQVAQRTKMSNIVAFVQAILSSVIKPLNDRFAQQASGYNDFVRRNIHLFTLPQPSPAADLKISVGKMSPVIATAGTQGVEPNSLNFNFPTTINDPFASADDEIYCVAQNTVTGDIGVQESPALRSSGEVVVNFKDDWESGEKINVWMAARRVDGTIVGNTGFAEVTPT